MKKFQHIGNGIYLSNHENDEPIFLKIKTSKKEVLTSIFMIAFFLILFQLLKMGLDIFFMIFFLILMHNLASYRLITIDIKNKSIIKTINHFGFFKNKRIEIKNFDFLSFEIDEAHDAEGIKSGFKIDLVKGKQTKAFIPSSDMDIIQKITKVLGDNGFEVINKVNSK